MIALLVVGVVAALILAIAAGAGRQLTAARLQVVADLAALACADGEWSRCESVSTANGAELVQTVFVGESAVVTVGNEGREASASAHVQWAAVGNASTDVDFPRARRHKWSG
jgi:uncharacterized membrane protein